MGQHRTHRYLSRLAGSIGALVAALGPTAASAHFGITGTVDLIVDYGLLALIGLLVVGGAATSAWLAAGSPDEDDDGEGHEWAPSEAATEDAPVVPPATTPRNPVEPDTLTHSNPPQ